MTWEKRIGKAGALSKMLLSTCIISPPTGCYPIVLKNCSSLYFYYQNKITESFASSLLVQFCKVAFEARIHYGMSIDRETLLYPLNIILFLDWGILVTDGQ